MNTLDLSGKIDAKSIAIYTAIDNVARELNIQYVVVGASARDLVLHYGYGAKIKRATADIDFGIQVPDWQTFEVLSSKLIGAGFEESKIQHRLIYDDMKIDLVPFGAIQNDEAKISWPPKGDVEMNVLGFQEAVENSVNVIIQDDPKIEIPVVMPAGLSLLKIICWTDRDADLKNKDAKDLLYLLKSYEGIPEVMNSLHDYPELEEQFEWDMTLGSAFKLGIDSASISSEQTKGYIKRIENDEIDKRTSDMLIEDMCENIEEEFESNKQLLSAYFLGFNR
jgi:predicted nucleotidyltransferase